MRLASTAVQIGIPEFVPDLIGLASVVVLLLMLAALGGIIYRTMTGGIEWPDDKEHDEDSVRRSRDDDDEWEFY
jgi:hypothetical protein